ncbi:hypothetical protein [Kordiimonas gwangyangensis]|uniref:hypothetical protein n=1 Tax=Kordiimonas gwangyangensis TaxID=288022 RepID=UPI0012DECBCD|nr:hypothetical protein [Kordiimonas gwangyangensis]
MADQKSIWRACVNKWKSIRLFSRAVNASARRDFATSNRLLALMPRYGRADVQALMLASANHFNLREYEESFDFLKAAVGCLITERSIRFENRQYMLEYACLLRSKFVQTGEVEHFIIPVPKAYQKSRVSGHLRAHFPLG